MDVFFIVLGIALGALLLVLALCLFLIAPSGKMRGEMERYRSEKFAHRGLHDATRAENSMSAFAAAVSAGYGIELDVRLTRDGEVVVFHDDTLERVAGVCGRVDSYTLAELREMRLLGTADTIPTFREVLDLVGGRVPLLVEIKEEVFKYDVTEAVAKMLRDYEGEYIVESFNPLALVRFRSLVPGVPCGLLCDNYLTQKKYRKPMYFIVQFMLFNVRCRPDFIAFNHLGWRNSSLLLIRAFFRKTPLICWTVKSAEEEAEAKKHGFTGIIFEGYNIERN